MADIARRIRLVGGAAPKDGEQGATYCSLFDLSTARALTAQDRARLHAIDVGEVPSTSDGGAGPYAQLFERVQAFVTDNGYL